VVTATTTKEAAVALEGDVRGADHREGADELPCADRVRALRQARETAGDLRWLGMAVPTVYVQMAAEFERLVGCGTYAAWLAAAHQGAAQATGRAALPAADQASRARQGRASWRPRHRQAAPPIPAPAAG
jgi:hypothetical protein